MSFNIHVLKARGWMVLNKGGSTSNQSNPTTINTDRRVAVQDGQGISGDGSSAYSSESFSYTDNSNSAETIKYLSGQGSDTITALANAGTDIIKNSGGAVIELAKFQGAQNTESFNTLVTQGGNLLDKLLDKSSEGFGLASKVVDSFTPTESKTADTGKYAVWAAAALAAVVLINGFKK